MTSEPKNTLLLNRLVLTSNTQATKKKSRDYKLRIYGKGIQCHSNHSPQLFELEKKKKKQQKTYLRG